MTVSNRIPIGAHNRPLPEPMLTMSLWPQEGTETSYQLAKNTTWRVSTIKLKCLVLFVQLMKWLLWKDRRKTLNQECPRWPRKSQRTTRAKPGLTNGWRSRRPSKRSLKGSTKLGKRRSVKIKFTTGWKNASHARRKNSSSLTLF